jgi:hypothetical protein
VGGVFRGGILGDNSDVSKETMKVKAPEDVRMTRFVTDSRLKNLNDQYGGSRFGNMNY